MHTDREACYRAVKSRDRRFDGVFYTAVRTTGIYCRPSCPARTPAFANVTFFPTAAAAQAAGFRACKRCLPDATPGSPDWDVRADAAGPRDAADRRRRRRPRGRRGAGRPARLHARASSPDPHRRARRRAARAGPRAARADRPRAGRDHRAGLADVAFAAGFSSVRQFNDTVREVYAATPTELRGPARRTARRPARSGSGWPCARRSPGARCSSSPTRRPGDRGGRVRGWYARTLALPHGPAPCAARARRRPRGGQTPRSCPRRSGSPTSATLAAAVERVRRLLDADCDPVAVDDALRGRPGAGAARAGDARAARARPRRRRRARRPRGARPAGQRRRRAHRSPARLVAEHGEPCPPEPASTG
jgi:AraC family transcriptional regulator of adaptative response / DNA-3-methyladenine glycosylase II